MPFVLESNQVAVTTASHDIILFDAPIETRGLEADMFFDISLPINSIRPAFRLEFDSTDFNNDAASGMNFYEIKEKLYKVSHENDTPYKNGVNWHSSTPNASQNQNNKSWTPYSESTDNVDKRITLIDGMRLRTSTVNDGSNKLQHEIAELAVKAHFEAPLDILNHENKANLLESIGLLSTQITESFRNQLRDISYNSGQSQNDNMTLSGRNVRRGICESLFSSALNHDANGDENNDDLLHRINNAVEKFKDKRDGVNGETAVVSDDDGILRTTVNFTAGIDSTGVVVDISGLAIETSQADINHIKMDFPFAVGDKIKVTLIYVIQSKLMLSSDVESVGESSSRITETNLLRQLYGSRVKGYEHSGENSTFPGLSGESLAYVGGAYAVGSVEEGGEGENRYDALFFNTVVDNETGEETVSRVTFADSQASGTQYSFLNRVVEVTITLSEDNESTALGNMVDDPPTDTPADPAP